VQFRPLENRVIRGLFLYKDKLLHHCYLHSLSGDDSRELVREVLPIDLVDVEIWNGRAISLQVYILVMGSN